MTEITQADRDAAASGYFAWCSGNPVIPDRMKAGTADDHSMVQAFARHRDQAERETVGKIARWLVNIVDMEDVDNEGWGACTIAYKLKQGEWKQ